MPMTCMSEADTLVADLTIAKAADGGDRQRQVSYNSKILVMDEPTPQSLTKR